FYVILEHFADNSEEKELADYGMMFWGNLNHEYLEAAMGYPSNFSWINYQQRGWNDPHVIGYMESHDEERMVYKNINFGNSQGNYNVKDPRTALRRAELAATLFFPIPGPKMFWQFGEVGYDFSINRCTDGTIAPNCRLSRKPIRWDYLQDPDRFRLFRVFSTLIELKTTHPTFQTTDFAVDLSSVGKRIHLNHDSMDVTILGNFDVEAISINPGFQETGTWYEYFTGEQLDVLSVSAPIELAPGEYRMYTNVELPGPDIPTSVNAPQVNALDLQVFPNPARESVTFAYTLDLNVPVQLLVYDLTGRPVDNLASSSQGSGRQQLTWDGRNEQGQLLPGGVYLYRLTTGEAVTSGNLVLTR
ncbi:MAG: FlgD immunoglobulin-like domain containing protein, partial [Bacteroidota bacterium]